MNFDNKNAIKRVTPCKFLCQIIFCNVEFAQNCRKFEFSGEKIEFHGKKSSFAIFGQNEFPSKRTKKNFFINWRVEILCMRYVVDSHSRQVSLLDEVIK